MIYFFYGDEEFNISKTVKNLKNALDSDFIEMSYKHSDNPDFPEFVAAIKTQPMMFGKMLVEIDCFSYLSSEKTFDDNQLEQISSALENISENIDLILCAKIPPNSRKKIDKRKKLFKIFSKYNVQEFAQIPSYKTSELESWIKKQAESKDLKLSNDVAAQMLIQVGSNLRLLDTELEKLKTYAGKNSVTQEMIKEICTTNEDLFAFLDYLIKGNIAKALIEYQKLLAKKHPLEILSVLHTLIHGKIQIKANSSRFSPDEIAKMTNMHPYRVKLEIQNLKNVSLKKLVKIKTNLTDAEFKIKSGKSNLSMDKEIEYAILQ